MVSPNLNSRVQAIRSFNRFYTKQIGVLREGLLKSPFSLTEVRVLYEIGHRDKATASELCKELDLDPGYLSRILTNFEKRGLIDKSPSEADGRQSLLSLTQQGQKTLAPLEARSNEEVAAMLGRLSEDEQKRLVDAMHCIKRLLDPASDAPQPPYLLRPHQPGDMGWVVHRHGVLYSQEYGYDEHFEALIAEIVAGFIQHFDPEARTLLDRRKRRRDRRLRLPGQEIEDRSQAAAVVSRACRARAGHRQALGGGVYPLRPPGRIQKDDAVDAKRSSRRSAHLRAGWLPPDAKKPHHSWGRDLISETWDLKL